MRGINGLRKLIQGQEEYPPSQDLWEQMIYMISQPAKKNVQETMISEMNQYKPSLPEPTLARFFHDGEYFFIDSSFQIYRTDPKNPLVGNLVGCVRKEEDLLIVKIDGKDIHTIIGVKVKEGDFHKRTYYTDSDKHVYRGFHPGNNLIFQVGSLNKEGRIELG